MSVSVDVQFDPKQVADLSDKRILAAVKRALGKAGSNALRDMKSEASKQIRMRKRLKAGYVASMFRLRRPRGNALDGSEWALDVRGKATPLQTYPYKQVKAGVIVEINKGDRRLIKHAFVAVMTHGGIGGGGAGHKGIFIRSGGAGRLPILQLIGSRPVDALLFRDTAETVMLRGARSMGATFQRVLPLEIGKADK